MAPWRHRSVSGTACGCGLCIELILQGQDYLTFPCPAAVDRPTQLSDSGMAPNAATVAIPVILRCVWLFAKIFNYTFSVLFDVDMCPTPPHHTCSSSMELCDPQKFTSQGSLYVCGVHTWTPSCSFFGTPPDRRSILRFGHFWCG